MVYSLDVINSDAMILANPPSPTVANHAVKVYFGGSGIQDFAGPTPFIDFSTSIDRNEAGEALGIVHKITLNGKIVRDSSNPTTFLNGSGISYVTSGISGLQQVFTKNACGTFEVVCITGPSSSGTIFKAHNVRAISYDVNKSNDNWIFTADYSAVLEYYEPAYSGWYVKTYSDDWTIEPLEDYVYNQGVISVMQKSEYDNPLLKPNAATRNSQQPQSSSSNTNTGATANASIDIGYVNIPRFKISRTISAVGIPSGTGDFCATDSNKVINNYDYPAMSWNAFNNAKKWVNDRASLVFGTNSAGSLWTILGTNSGYLYNHLRSTNFNVSAAKYEITDSWLAMPTGISYLEDYSLEMSTDDKYIHTVRVQGEIIGLQISNSSISGYPYVSSTGNKLTLDLIHSSTGLVSGTLSPAHQVSDASTTTAVVNSAVTNITTSKYTNALSGWIYDIKPYLYRRACIPMNNKADRTKGYIDPTTQPPVPPNNPVYSTHGILNIVPISTSESHNPKRGSISYSYEFNNKFTIISGVLYENINIEETGPTDIIGEAFVLGRSLGPVLQNLGAKTASRKNITIEVGVVPPSSMIGFFMQNKSCPLYTGGTVYSTITGIIEGLKPFGDRNNIIFGNLDLTNSNRANNNAQGQVYLTSDNQTWDPTNGRYSRSVGWVYQQCTNAKSYLDY